MEYPRLMTAMITPFNAQYQVDSEKAKQMARYLAENGSDGIVVCGTTGESPTLTSDEKLQLFQTVKDAVGGRVQIWAGIGSNATLSTVELAKKAAAIGVDGIMAVAPYYNKPTQDGLYLHFKSIADAVSIPLMMYNIPSRTSINMLPETVARLAAIENITALKESSGMMDQTSMLKRLLPDDFMLYCGDDSLTLPMMALGAHGVVSVASHLIGKPMAEMIQRFTAGDTKRALELHLQLFDVFKVLFITTSPILLKEALRLKGMDTGLLRPPLCAPNEKEKQELETVLRSQQLI
ncbi:MAG: 4-hydroxy-tetrahydrodipicolinate synthase [Solirubrobacterales bacterium]